MPRASEPRERTPYADWALACTALVALVLLFAPSGRTRPSPGALPATAALPSSAAPSPAPSPVPSPVPWIAAWKPTSFPYEPFVDRAAKNETCARCHSAIAEEWRASFHRAAYSDPSFQLALVSDPLPFCKRCHAPEGDPSYLPSALASELGVACTSCHAAHLDDPTRPELPAGHLSMRPEAVVAEAGCAPCHEFSFPDLAVRRRPEAMQLTMTEHAHSSAAETSCASCHMPRLAGSPTTGSASGTHASHRFDSAHDPAFVRSALLVTAKRLGANSIEVRLELVDAGHVVPTGDLFRRIMVEAFVGEAKQPIAREVRYLARHFAYEQQIHGAVVRVARRDDRVGADGQSESRIVLPLEGAEGREIGWRVVYQRVQSLGAREEGDAVIAGEVEIAHGTTEP